MISKNQFVGLNSQRYYLFFLFVFLFFAENLYSQKTREIPARSGGSYLNSRHSSSGVNIGPYSEKSKILLPEIAAILNTFEGFDFDDNATENDGFVFVPPDPIGAAGTDRVIGVVNTMIEAHDKTGTLLWRDALADFFAPLAPTTFTFDPKVVYDHYEGRFVVVTLEKVETGTNPDPGNTSFIMLAVSKTATPATATAADWFFHKIDSKTTIGWVDHWADYPGFELDEEAVYITNNMFAHDGAATVFGVRLWIVDKGVVGGFYAGSAAAVTVHDPYAGSGVKTTTMPALVFGAGGAGPGIGTYLVSFSGIAFGGIESVQVVRVDDPLGTPIFTQEFVSVGDIDTDVGELPDAPQFGTATLIEVNDRRCLDCVWRNDELWCTTTINPNSGPDTGETTAHWFKLLTSAVPGGAITLADQGNIGGEDIASGTYTFFSSVAVNSLGDAKFGFSASSPTTFAGAFLTGRRPGDTAGTVRATETVHAGEDFYVRTFGDTRNRWGDYSGISVDPTNDVTFWVFNEYAAERGTVISGEDGRWGTAWASSDFGSGDPAVVFRVQRSTGDVFAKGSFIGGGADLAEHINVTEPVEPGDIVELDPTKPMHYRKARGYSQLIAGVITTEPGFTLGNRPGKKETARAQAFEKTVTSETSGRFLLALMGRVPIKVTTENGSIRPGDLLTVSSLPGYAMRCADSKVCEAVIGKALEGLVKDKGTILALIMSH